MSLSSTRRGARLIWVITLLLLIPVVPVIVLGEAWAAPVWRWAQSSDASGPLALVATGLLAADIFLPVPSAPLLVLLADRLGAWPTLLLGVSGLTIGGVLGYLAVSWGGRGLAARLAGETELQACERYFGREGAWLIALTRPVPIVAEAVVLAAGLARMPWQLFLLSLLLGNLVTVAIYAALGSMAAKHELTLSAAAAVAVISLLLARSALPPKQDDLP